MNFVAVGENSLKFGGETLKFGENLRQLRVSSRHSQAQIAKILCVSQDTISLWETNKSYPDLKTFCAICKIYSVSADYLLGLENY